MRWSYIVLSVLFGLLGGLAIYGGKVGFGWSQFFLAVGFGLAAVPWRKKTHPIK